MLTVETYLKESPGRGIGLFAKNAIPKGTIYWIRNEEFDRVFSDKTISEYDRLTSDFIITYGFLETNGNWYLCSDNAKYSNHLSRSNTTIIFNSSGLVQSHVASKLIHPDEEIFCDYSEICLACKNGLNFVETNI